MGTTTGELITTPQYDRPPAQHGVVQTDAGGNEIARSAEVNTSALEAQARAMIQARFFIAQQPHMQRDWEQVERKLIKECRRPGFAWASWFTLPIGNDPKKFPQGFTIRFAEAALRMSKNVHVEQVTVFDDPWRRTIRVTVLDLESNFDYSSDISIEKTVERQAATDRVVVGERLNSSNKKIYIVQATEQEMALKTGSATSKAIRTNGLRLIPGDILAECKAIILATRSDGQKAEDPELARKTVLDDFAALGVMPDQVGQFLGHKTEVIAPDELTLLRETLVALKEGMTTWREIMASREEDKPARPPMQEPQRTDQPRPQPQQTQPSPTPEPARPKPPAAAPQQQQAQQPQGTADLEKQAAEKWQSPDEMDADFRTTIDLVGPAAAQKFFQERKVNPRALSAGRTKGQLLQIYRDLQELIPDQKGGGGGKGELFPK